MQLRSGKKISTITSSIPIPAIKSIPATPSNSPTVKQVPTGDSFARVVFGIPHPVFTNALGYTPFNPNYNRIFKETNCDCGKVCDLSNGKCCSCLDQRTKIAKKEWRGHGIMYNNQSWGYCPKCRTADVEIHMDKIGEGYF